MCKHIVSETLYNTICTIFFNKKESFQPHFKSRCSVSWISTKYFKSPLIANGALVYQSKANICIVQHSQCMHGYFVGFSPFLWYKTCMHQIVDKINCRVHELKQRFSEPASCCHLKSVMWFGHAGTSMDSRGLESKDKNMKLEMSIQLHIKVAEIMMTVSRTRCIHYLSQLHWSSWACYYHGSVKAKLISVCYRLSVLDACDDNAKMLASLVS